MNNEIGFAVVGLGMGKNRSRIISRTEGAKLITVCDINKERAEVVSKELQCDFCCNYEEVLKNKNVDVVQIMTPSGMHADMAIKAIECGKNTIVTKPIDIDLKKVDKLIKVIEKHNVKFSVDFECRYSKDNLAIKQAIDDGKLGKLIFGESKTKWYRSDKYYEDWHGTWALDGGGSLINQSIHQIDLFQWFMGDVDSIVGKTGIFTHKIETEDLGVGLINFKNGAYGIIMGTTTFAWDSPTRIEVHGDKSAVITEGDKIKTWKYRNEENKAVDYEYNLNIPAPNNVIEDMIIAIRENKPLMVDAYEGRKSLEIILGIYESSKTGKPVKLPL